MRDVRIMDIAMNLARIGNWAADDFNGRQKRIKMFLDQTNTYLYSLDIASYPQTVQRTLLQFSKAFDRLITEMPQLPSDSPRWAEVMLTWSNILTHRARIGE